MIWSSFFIGFIAGAGTVCILIFMLFWVLYVISGELPEYEDSHDEMMFRNIEPWDGEEENEKDGV